MAAHDRIKVLDEWEEIYHRLAIEFKENKGRRLHSRAARKYPANKLQKAPKVFQKKVAKVAKVQHRRRRLNGKIVYDPTNGADIINP